MRQSIEYSLRLRNGALQCSNGSLQALERVYALLAKSAVFAELAATPPLMRLFEAVLGPNFLLSACLAINVHPGETAQALHSTTVSIRPAPVLQFDHRLEH